MYKNLFTLGRVLIGIYFLLPGMTKVFLFSANLEVVIAKEGPFPVFSLSLVAIAQIFLGSFIIFGKYLRISSIGLAITTLLINLYIHDFSTTHMYTLDIFSSVQLLSSRLLVIST